MASVKAQIVIGFDNVVTEEPAYLYDLVIDGVAREITALASGAVSANWEFNVGVTDDVTADNFKAMLLANSSNYTVSNSVEGTGYKSTIDAKDWGASENFGTPSVDPGLGISLVSQRDNNVDTMVVTAVVTDNLCHGAATGAIDVSVTGGASPFTYGWADGPATTQDRTNLTAGSYWVTVTDALGNQVTKSNIQVSSPQAIVITEVITNATGGGSNGAIDVSVTGGNGVYTYAWDDGPATTQDRTGLASGSYMVTVTDGNGCTNQKTFVVADGDSAITLSPSITHVLCNGASTGAIDITPANGTAPYTVVWSDGPTSEDRTGLPAGDYIVTVTDNVGSVKQQTITVTEPTAISVEAAVEGKDITLTVTGGTSPYTYLWSTTETTKDITVTVEGDYTVTVTDDNGCTLEVTVKVEAFTFYWSGNPIELALAADTPGSKANLSFVCEVYIEEIYLSETYSKVIDLEQPADDAGTTIFDVQDVIHAYLEATLPTWELNQVALALGHFVRFYLKFAEKYGDPPVTQTFTQKNTYYALLGGLSDIEFAAGTFMDTYLTTTKPFYTWEPTDKDVFDDTQHYLHYMVNEFGVGGISLHCKIYYDDGTTSELQMLNSISTPERFEVYRFPVGYAQLDLGNVNPAKTIEKYQVWIEDNLAAVISEVRTFTLVVRPTYCREFIYKNSLGGWSTLIAEGEASGAVDVSATEARQTLDSGFKTTDSDVNVVRKVGQQNLAVMGGYYDNEGAAHLQDFALSTRVFEMVNNRFEPVRIEYNPAFINERDNYVTLEFVVIPQLLKQYTPPLS